MRGVLVLSDSVFFSFHLLSTLHESWAALDGMSRGFVVLCWTRCPGNVSLTIFFFQ